MTHYLKSRNRHQVALKTQKIPQVHQHEYFCNQDDLIFDANCYFRLKLVILVQNMIFSWTFLGKYGFTLEQTWFGVHILNLDSNWWPPYFPNQTDLSISRHIYVASIPSMSKVETFSFFPESQIKSISRSLLSALTIQPYSFKSRFLSFRTTKSPGLNFSLTYQFKLLI